jgi:hypothetical protein
MPLIDEFLGAIELHDPDELRRVIDAGLDVREPLRGKLATTWLLEMYTRGPRFGACLASLLERGAPLADPRLEPLLLDDAAALRAALAADPTLLQLRVDVACAFTPLEQAPLLHVAAEYGRTGALRVLLDAGLDVDARAGFDEHGLGGHTALFHTVNSNANLARPALELLLDAGARADVLIPGLVWGRGYEWESAFFDLTPIAYAQLGLLPQVHRDERQIADNVRRLLAAAGRDPQALVNVPNRYLARG